MQGLENMLRAGARQAFLPERPREQAKMASNSVTNLRTLRRALTGSRMKVATPVLASTDMSGLRLARKGRGPAIRQGSSLGRSPYSL